MIKVVKAGGGLLENPQEFLHGFAALGGSKVLVHGGGREATDLAARLGIEARMIEGRRVTDSAMLEIVTMVYGGLMNKRLVASLQALGINALGLTGADLGIIRSHKRPPVKFGGEGQYIDYGYVGDIDSVDREMLGSLIRKGIVPVIAPLTYGEGTLLNTNADSVACAVASALAPSELVYCFEKPGVLDKDGKVIEHVDKAAFAALKADGTVSAGMIPKLDNAFAALEAGVVGVRICGVSNMGAGTLVTL